MYQKLVLVGNLGADPESREVGGTTVCNFPLATNRKWNSKDGEKQEETTWFRISVWGKQAEACQRYLSKGRQVLVEGRLTADKETGGPRVYELSDGRKAASYEVTAETVRFLSGGDASDSGGSTQAKADTFGGDFDIPF